MPSDPVTREAAGPHRLDLGSVEPQPSFEQLCLQIDQCLRNLLRGAHQKAVVQVPHVPYQAHVGCDMTNKFLDCNTKGNWAKWAALVHAALRIEISPRGI